MSVAILLITHDTMGQQLMATAEVALKKLPTTVRSLTVSTDCQPEQVIAKAQALIQTIDQGDGVLILSDLYGSTPGNISMRLCSHNIRVVFGVNLAMLIKVLNYCQLPLATLSDKAVEGGMAAIKHCPLPS